LAPFPGKRDHEQAAATFFAWLATTDPAYDNRLGVEEPSVSKSEVVSRRACLRSRVAGSLVQPLAIRFAFRR
jgi:hypothetical protein